LATIQSKGEYLRRAVKRIPSEWLEDEEKSISLPIQEVTLRLNLSPKRDPSSRLVLSFGSMNRVGSGFAEPRVDSVVILGQGPER
jgi:hypothetical protein